MPIIKGVDSPDKLLVIVLLCGILAVLIMHRPAWQEQRFRSASADTNQFTILPKALPKIRNIGRSKMHRNLFAWSKIRQDRALADIPLLESLDVRAIRLVGTVVDKGQRFAWISPLTKRAPLLRIGLHETIGQDGWQVAAIHKEAVYLEKRLHGKSRQLVFHLPKV